MSSFSFWRCFHENSGFSPRNRLAGMKVPPGGTSVWPKFWVLPWGAWLWVVIRQADPEVWRCFDVSMNFRNRLMSHFVLVLIIWLSLIESWCFCEISGNLPRNRLAGMHVPPGNTSVLASSGRSCLSCLAVGGIPPGGSWCLWLLVLFSWIFYACGFLSGWLTDWGYLIICGCFFVKNDHSFDYGYNP